MEDKMINCEEARQIDMVDYLAKAGHHPKKVRDNDYWYLSPLRNEKTPSFKINRKINRWYDHGIGKGGNIIDFALIFHNCKINEWLHRLKGDFLPHQPPADAIKSTKKLIVVHEILPLRSPALSTYLRQRNIPLSVAHNFCVEVRYKFHEKIYYGIGFKNDGGGYEIRNPYYKNGSSPKGITTIKNNDNKIAVFEGFFDFLSFISMFRSLRDNSYSFCILNSLSFFETAKPFLEEHSAIHLFLDRDNAGVNCTKHALRISPKYIDGSNLYKGYKDLNEWWVNKGLSPKRRVAFKFS